MLPPLWEWQADELAEYGNSDKRAIFASPRLGKSRVAAECLLKADAPRSMIIAPLTVCPQWADLLEEHGGFGNVIRGYGIGRNAVRDLLAEAPNATIVVSDSILADTEVGDKYNGDLKVRDGYTIRGAADRARAWLGDGALIVDESHRFAGVSAKRSRAMRRLAWQAGYVRLLTGTPGRNHEGNLWGQMVALDPAAWDTSYERFAQKYLIRDSLYRNKVYGVKNEAALQKLLLERASIVRREDVFGPDQWQYVVRNIELPPAAAALYKKLAREWVLDSPDLTVPNAAVRLMRLQQLTSGHLPDGGTEIEIHSAKIDACLDDLDEIVYGGEKAVVYYKFKLEGKRMLEAARKKFKKAPVLHIGGEVNVEARDQVYKTIEKHQGGAVAVVQIAAGGIGRSFAEAGYEMFLSHDFSFDIYEQARDRIYKQGHPRVVTFYRVPKSVDWLIANALERGQNVHDRIRTADIEEWVHGV